MSRYDSRKEAPCFGLSGAPTAQAVGMGTWEQQMKLEIAAGLGVRKPVDDGVR